MSHLYPPDNSHQQLNYQQGYQQPMPQQPQSAFMPQQAPQYPPVGQTAPYPPYPQYPQVGQPAQYAPQTIMPPQMVQTNINVNMQHSGPGFFVRALYFCFIGWWLGLFWLNLGFSLCALIVTLPIGLMMLNRLPQVMTLKPAGTSTNVNVSTVAVQAPYGGAAVMQQNINVTVGGTQQYNFFLRALYFILVGWWAGYLWANLAYACCLLIVLLPVGVMMFDRLPMVLTLRKN